MFHSLAIFIVCLFVTFTIETYVLLKLLSARHSTSCRLYSGFWLTACTYPVVVLVIPFFFDGNTSTFSYQLVAELFAAGCECFLFWFLFNRDADRLSMLRDSKAIILANLLSYSSGLIIHPLLGL